MTIGYRLSDVWVRSAKRAPGVRFGRSEAEWMVGEDLCAWGAGDHVTIEPVTTQGQLAGVRESLQASGTSMSLGVEPRVVTRAWKGTAEAVTAVSAGERLPDPPIGLLSFRRQLLVDDFDSPGEPRLIDLEIEIGELAVRPDLQQRGHGKLLSMAIASTIISDVKALIGQASIFGERIDLCIALAGVSLSAAADRVLLAGLRMLERGLEMLDPVDEAVVADLRLSVSEIEFSESVPVARRGGLLSAV